MVSCITCNSDAAGFICHNKLLLYIFFPSYCIITKWCHLFPSQKWQPLWPLVRKSRANSLYHLFDLVWSSVLTFYKTIGLHMDFHRGLVEIPSSVSRSVCINDGVAWRPMGNSRCMYVWVDSSADGYFLYVPLFPCNVSLVGTKWSARMYLLVLHSHTSVLTPAYTGGKKASQGCNGG